MGINMGFFASGDRIQKLFRLKGTKKMSEINMYQNFFNTLWEFIGGKEDKDNFIQKTLKVSTLSMVCLIMYMKMLYNTN